MSKICKDIICGEKYFYINERKELICKAADSVNQIMKSCTDFDAVCDGNGIIHIISCDNQGNLLYIFNDKNRWGRGILEPSIRAENIFVFFSENGLSLFYVSGETLFSRSIDNQIHKPVSIDRIEITKPFFADNNTAFYVNKKGSLVSKTPNGNYVEICSGEEIRALFVKDGSAVLKDGEELKLINTEAPFVQQSLTRRHTKDARCPVLINTSNEQILCWCDGPTVFSAKKSGDKWSQLNSFSASSPHRLGIFKFDGHYDLGCIAKGRVCSLNSARN